MTFAKDFVWGAATAAYQIEGAWDADGKGLSVWDQMSHWPGKVFSGDTGDVACDHYHRMNEDVTLMADIGLQAYRFSISWPRVIPAGSGPVNEAGLDFYDRLVDALLKNGIEPWVTLFHWDYPLDLYQRGGWLNTDSPNWFADYTELLARRLGDRVGNWMTLNEPNIFGNHGHRQGNHAPGVILPDRDLVTLAHHVLLAHGKAVQALRENCFATPSIGWAPAVSPCVPENDSPELVEAAYEDTFATGGPDWLNSGLGWWNEPVFKGAYPPDGLQRLGRYLPKGWEQDLQTICQPLDFCGLNVYHSSGRAVASSTGEITIIDERERGNGYPRTLFNWPVTPQALYWGARFFKERYDVPIVITENGMSGHDWVHLDGKVHDAHRIDFTRRYLLELARAIDDGVDVRGYFHWSLLDNFEWDSGYKHRFGLIHVDLETLKRTPKESAYWYRDLIQSNGQDLFS